MLLEKGIELAFISNLRNRIFTNDGEMSGHCIKLWWLKDGGATVIIIAGLSGVGRLSRISRLSGKARMQPIGFAT